MSLENPNMNKKSQLRNPSSEGIIEKDTLNTGTLATLAALTVFSAGMDTAEARTTPIPINEQTPHVLKMQQALLQKGVEIKNLSSGLGGIRIGTNKGEIIISMPANSESSAIQNVLNNVSPESFVNEIERQNTRNRDIEERIPTDHGTVEIAITPYAQKVLEQNNYTYRDGVIYSTINSSKINLLGTKAEPNDKCTVYGSGKSFQNSIEALCKELRISPTGTPYASDVRYTITFTGSSFTVEQEVKR